MSYEKANLLSDLVAGHDVVLLATLKEGVIKVDKNGKPFLFGTIEGHSAQVPIRAWDYSGPVGTKVVPVGSIIKLQGREPEPDEITMRLSHLAGMLESRGEIASSEWDDLTRAIKDAENAYYNDVRFTTASSLEEVAERIFKERFPVSLDKTAAIPNTSIKKAEQILVDNGIEQDEAATVLQAQG